MLQSRVPQLFYLNLFQEIIVNHQTITPNMILAQLYPQVDIS